MQVSAAPVAVKLSGAVEKGPFLLGSSVSVTPASVEPADVTAMATTSGAALAGDASADVAPAAGQVFKTETSNDLGQFSLTVAYQGFATIEGTGYYYNEATGDLSSSQLTLRAFHEIGDTDGSAHVNLITHLTYQRVQHLIGDGVDAAAAITQAESELHTALGIGAPHAAASDLALSGGDNDDDAYLFAVSTVFAQAAYVAAVGSNCGKACVDSKLQELLNTTSAHFAVDGTLAADTGEQLQEARFTINNETVMAALADRLDKTGSTAKVPDLNRVIPWETPQNVTDCAANVLPSVSHECALAVCGVNQRPIATDAVHELSYWQAHMSECDENCWTAIRCSIDKCLWVPNPETGNRVVSASCAAAMCAAGDLQAWTEHVFYSASNGECQ